MSNISLLTIVAATLLTLTTAQAHGSGIVDNELVTQNGRIIKKIELDEVYTLADKYATSQAGFLDISKQIPVPLIWHNPRKKGGTTYLGRWWKCAARSDGTDGYKKGACNSVVAVEIVESK
ncbi:hypothetical protein [Vibrio sp. M260118]|uniref:hypothetical protein n=1 Tax=Vibrio sp. M260118 TaxID=3020896 RepID=UPI002F3EF64B